MDNLELPKLELPKALIKKRLHSLFGIGITLYLMVHLYVNSQAALFFGQDGKDFIHSVNSIHDLPYLPVIEILILAIPIFVHGFLGVFYGLTGKFNSMQTDGTTPSLPFYERNKAYTWQRITAYFLIIGIALHVLHMRFINHPLEVKINNQEYFLVQVNMDEGIDQVAKRLDVQIYHPEKKDSLSIQEPFIKASKNFHLKQGQAVAIAKNFGTAELLMLRETFKVPLMMFLYSIFVLFACFHGFNGLWTFLISQGIIVNENSRRLFLKISYGLMFLFSMLGLLTIYGTYWINLKN